jgi:hypothetical protein
MYLVHPCGSIWFYNFLAWTARVSLTCGGQRGCNPLLRLRLHLRERPSPPRGGADALSRPPRTHWAAGMSMRQERSSRRGDTH